MLREFYNEYYHSDNCAVFLSGKITDEIIRRVESAFDAPFGNRQHSFIKKEYTISTSTEKRIFTEQDDALQSAVKLGTVTIPRQHPDYLKLRVLMTLFGGYFGSRLMSNIREDKGYTYGISAGTMFYPDSGILLISTETDNEYVEPLIREIYHEIDKLHTGTVSEAELSISAIICWGKCAATTNRLSHWQMPGCLSIPPDWTMLISPVRCRPSRRSHPKRSENWPIAICAKRH